MKKTILAIVGVVAALVLVFYYVHRYEIGSPNPNTLQTHSLAPDFSLPDLNGQKLDLSAYRGKVVLLDFWATWCDPCLKEIPLFVELQDQYRNRGLQIIGISMDDGPEPVQDFYRRYKMNYPVAMGNAKLGRLYGGVLGLPTCFLIDRDGRIYTKHIGPVEISVIEEEIRKVLQEAGSQPRPRT